MNKITKASKQAVDITTASERFDGIQLLRGLAALLVLYSHTPLAGRYAFGSSGVDIFFVISGFIITHVTRNGYDRFLMKRAIRILPVLVFMTVVTLLQGSLSGQTFMRFVSSIIFLPLWWWYSPTVGAAWTLSFEVRFYIVFFIAVYNSIKRRKVYASVLVIFVVFFSVLFKQEDASVANPMLSIEFIYGIFAYWLLIEAKRPKIRIPAFVSAFISGVIMLVSLVALQWINHTYGTGTYRTFQLGIPSFIFFLAAFEFFRKVRVPRFARFLGDISFSLYLSHQLILKTTQRLLPTLDFRSLPIGLAQMALCVVVAIPIWYFIEKLFTNWLRKKLL